MSNYQEEEEREMWDAIASQDDPTTTITIRICWETQSRSSKGKWCRYLIDDLKKRGATYDPDSKTWSVPPSASSLLDRVSYRNVYEIVD